MRQHYLSKLYITKEIISQKYISVINPSFEKFILS